LKLRKKPFVRLLALKLKKKLLVSRQKRRLPESKPRKRLLV